MKCWKCDKEMDREDGGTTLKGVEVTVKISVEPITQADIDYYNEQLGKYSDGEGGCHVAICYECYTDVLLGHPILEVITHI